MLLNKVFSVLSVLLVTILATGNALAEVTETHSNLINYQIPDNSPSGNSSNLVIIETPAIPDNAVIDNTAFAVKVVHTWVSDLDLYLISPSGTTVQIWNNQGGETDQGIDDDAKMMGIFTS